MAKCSLSVRENIINPALGVLLCFTLLRACSTRNSFSDIDLSTQTLNPEVTGFMMTGNTANDWFGDSVRSAGDINGDGYDDIIVGASTKNNNQGRAYVLYGGSKSIMSHRDFNSAPTLNPSTTGFTITGSAAGDRCGSSVSTAGDINSDGYDDIIVGAGGKNTVYVIYGGATSTMSNWDFSSGATLNPTSTGFTITGETAADNFGMSVSKAGDINKDGYDDIIVGAYTKSSNKGAAYVIYGRSKSTMSNIVLSSTPLSPLTTGFTITGNTVNDLLGVSVNTAGDINNDGYDDIIVGAYNKNNRVGAAYVIYGGSTLTMSDWNFSSGATLNPTSTGFMITGNAASNSLGNSVSTAGDINNDGYDDIIIGAREKNNAQGAAYVIYGGAKSTMSNWDFSSGATLNPTSTGFMIIGNAASDWFGGSVSTAGDINNDGYDDIIIGAPNKNNLHGVAYVIYGGQKSSMSNILLSSTTLNPLTTGFMIAGNAAGDYFGNSVNTAGDINNDGYDDIIIGAYQKNSNRGAAYVIYASCPKGCKQCSSEPVCTECKSSYRLYQSECFNTCPNATFASTISACKDCAPNCNQCNSTSICTECISPFVLYKSVCLPSCPSAMFNSSNVCEDCPSYCSSCVSQDSCQVCYEGYTLSNSLCVLPPSSSTSSHQEVQEKATQSISSATRGISSIVCVGSTVAPFATLVSKTVQNTRYLNLSVTSDLAEIYKTWNTDLISWEAPNIFSNEDHFKPTPSLFAQYDTGSPFLVNFWPTLVNVGIGLTTFLLCFVFQRLLEKVKYKGWAHSLVQKLVAGSFNFALVQAYACLDDTLLYLVLDAKTNPFNTFFSWASMICAVVFLALGCLLVFSNFWTVKKYQSIKMQGVKEIEAFNEKNKYWELFYSDFSDNDLWSQSFFAILIIRSTASSLIITVLYEYPVMQTVYLVILDVAIISFLYFQTPFNTLRGKLAQYYYETITLLVHICAFTLSLQDSSTDPSDTIRLIFSFGIIYLNTALIGGSLGFMFIEIYEIISQKTKAAQRKKDQNKPKDNQETGPLQPSETDAQRRQGGTIEDQTVPIGNLSLQRVNQNGNVATYNSNLESFQALESSLNADNSRELVMYPSQQRNRRNLTFYQPLPRRFRQNHPAGRRSNVIHPARFVNE